MITVLSHNIYFSSAVHQQLKKIFLLQRVNIVDLKPIKYEYEKHANLHFLINSYDMNKNIVCFFYKNHLLCVVNKRTHMCLPHIIDCLQHGVPIGETINLTGNDIIFILTIGYDLLLDDYYQTLNVTPKTFSKNKHDLFRKFGIKSMPTLIAISHYIQSIEL